MNSPFVSVAVFLLVLVCVPFFVRWIKQRVPGQVDVSVGQSRVVSSLSVGPQQRVVVVEVGPKGRRVWLTLGVTLQGISCLHTITIDGLQIAHVDGFSVPSEESV